MKVTLDMGSLLTLTTGRLMGDASSAHRDLGLMVGEDIMTHQIPKALDLVVPYLAARYPDIAASEDTWPEFSQDREEAARQAQQIVRELAAIHGNTFEVEPCEGWTHGTAISDFFEMMAK